MSAELETQFLVCHFLSQVLTLWALFKKPCSMFDRQHILKSQRYIPYSLSSIGDCLILPCIQCLKIWLLDLVNGCAPSFPKSQRADVEELAKKPLFKDGCSICLRTASADYESSNCALTLTLDLWLVREEVINQTKTEPLAFKVNSSQLGQCWDWLDVNGYDKRRDGIESLYCIVQVF